MFLADQPVDPLNFIQNTTKVDFKTFVKESSKKLAFQKLMKQKMEHSKMKQLQYNSLKLQDYLMSRNIPLKTKQMICRIRIRMESFKANYKGSYDSLICSLCNTHVDSQMEALNCPKIKLEDTDADEMSSKYKNLFDENIDDESIKMMMTIMRQREKLLAT